MKKVLIIILSVFTLLIGIQNTEAVPVTFTKLTGLTGGSPASTAVYRADLSSIDGLAFISSVSITDNSKLLGGATGQFSGFDLDAILFSRSSVNTAAAAAGLAGINGFVFTPAPPPPPIVAGTIFTPGTQRPPVDPKLFGTGPAGNTVDNAVATLGSFDGNGTTAVPPAGPPVANGFISMGDNGILYFKLNLDIFVDGGLFLYIGEVGDNGEVAASTVEVNTPPPNVVPEPTTLFLLGSGLIGLAGYGRRKFLKK